MPEAERLAVLKDYEIMDTSPDEALDRVTQLVTQVLGVPTALVSLVDDHRQWFKSRVGMDVDHTARDIAFCDHVVRSGEMLVVPDSTQDARFSANPLVTDDPNIRFYAGIPLRVPEGAVLGTLCAIDYVPRELSPEQLDTLGQLAALVTERLVAHRNDRSLVAVREDLNLYRRFFAESRDLNCVASVDGRFLAINDQWTVLLGFLARSCCVSPSPRCSTLMMSPRRPPRWHDWGTHSPSSASGTVIVVKMDHIDGWSGPRNRRAGPMKRSSPARGM
jgi:GAF domain-containing protein